MEDLAMEKYDADTSAEAVILYDKGVFNSNTFQFKRHLRVKILKKSGYDRANLVLNIESKNMIRACTFNLVNGELIKTKLSNESIFPDEIVRGKTLFKVVMPEVREKTVIDIEYNFTGVPSEWKFQDRIPVRYSELYLEKTDYVIFSTIQFGHAPLSFSSMDRWIAKEMPALRDEPYVDNLDNYMTRMEISIQSVRNSNGSYTDYSTDWVKVAQWLKESDYFGKQLERGGFLKLEAEALVKDNQSVEEKIVIATGFIKDRIKWNGSERLFVSQELPSILNKEKIGNSADINLTLIILLKRMGIDVQTIVLSTVDNGILSFALPDTDKLNYVIGYVKSGDKVYFLDATESNLPAGLLPERCLNGRGRLIGENVNDWIDLTPKDKIFKEGIKSDLSLDPNGTFTGAITWTHYDYSAWSLRNKISNLDNEDDYLEKLSQDFPTLKIENLHLANLKEILANPVIETFSIDMTGTIENFGNYFGLYPFQFGSDNENPFKSKERVLPIYFPYPINKINYVNLSIPEGHEFFDLPKPKKVLLPNNAGSFTFTVNSITKTSINILYKIDIKKTLFLQEEYPGLRELYALISETLSAPILYKSSDINE